LFIMANTLVTSASGYVFWLVAAHLYSAPVNGLTSTIVSAGAIIMLLSVAGVAGTLIQTLSGQSEETEWSTTFWAGMATAVFFAVLLCGTALMVLPVISPKLSVLHSADYAAVFVVGTVAMAACLALDFVFIAERRAGYQFCRNIGAITAKMIALGLLGLAARPDPFHLLGAWGAESTFGLVLGIALLVRHRRVARPPGLSVLFRTVWGFRSFVAGNQVIGMALGLLPYLLVLLVTARLSPSDNAYFYIAWTLAGMLLIVSPAVSTSLFAEGVCRPGEVGTLARSAFRIIGAIVVPGLVAVLAVGRTVLSVFGPAYADHGVGLLRITVLAAIPHAVTCVYASILRAQGRLTTVGLLYLGISIGTLVISWLLLPVLGISAVGWAFLAMQLCGAVYVVLHWRIQTSPKRLHSRIYRREALPEASS
jgi:O-antigen/teichoic acid export membrane protein